MCLLLQPIIRETLEKEYVRDGVDLVKGRSPTQVRKDDDGLHVLLPASGDEPEKWLGPFERVVYAIGRDVSTSVGTRRPPCLVATSLLPRP